MSLIYNNRNTQTKLANSFSHYLRWYKMECINNTTFAARICFIGRLTYSNLENVTNNRIGSFVMKKKASENISFIICVILLSITARSNKNHLEMPQSNKSWISWKSWIEYPLSCSNFYKVYGHFFVIHSYRIGIFCGMFFFLRHNIRFDHLNHKTISYVSTTFWSIIWTNFRKNRTIFYACGFMWVL